MNKFLMGHIVTVQLVLFILSLTLFAITPTCITGVSLFITAGCYALVAISEGKFFGGVS